MEPPSSQIPFPHGGDSPLLSMHGGKQLFNAGYGDESKKDASLPAAHRRLDSSHSRRPSENGSQIFPEISPSSSPSKQGESLPSIHNLLHSIGQEAADPPANLVRRSPSAPALPSSTQFATPSEPLSSQFHPGGIVPGPANASLYMGPHHPDRQKTFAWESAAPPLRSMSPQRRPPLAPSAFAHSQYIHHANSRSDGAIYRPNSAMSSRNHRGVLASVFQSGDNHRKQKTLHSPSSSIPSITSEELDGIPLPSIGPSGPWNTAPPATNLMKRSLQSQPEMEDAANPSAFSRRRHTVGALEEPHGLHTALDQSRSAAHRPRKSTEDSTPRGTSQQRMRPYASRPESPTTPTAGMAMAPRWDGAGSVGGMMATHPSHHRVYMQHAEQASDSLPSLSSSISATSLVSDRARVHSLEDLSDRRMLPPGWSHASDTIYMDKSAIDQSMPSPRTTMWHSRSSTFESVDTHSSYTSHHSPYNRPVLPPRSSSLLVDANEDSAAWSASGNPARRARDMATPYAFAKERTRQNSMRGNTVHRSHSLRTEPASQLGHSSLISPMEASQRPRAQTVTYPDRGGGQLPSHSQSVYLPSSSSSAILMSSRSLSSHSQSSVASLPTRVSSMEINQEASRARHLYDRNVMPSSSSSTGNLSHVSPGSRINSAMTSTGTDAGFVAVSGTGHAGGPKYQCGWCGKRFSRPSSLKIHHHSHTGEKPFACTAPNCGRTFSVQSNLRRHQKCHSAQGSAKGQSLEDGPLVGYSRLQEGPASVSHHDERSYARVGPTTAASSSLFNNQAYSFQQGALPSSYSSPGHTMDHIRNANPSDRSDRNHGFASSHTDSFMQSREQVPSSTSSNAEEEEGTENGEEEDDDNSMQDIREENVVVAAPSSDRSALQGLLN